LLQIGAFSRWFANQRITVGERKISIADKWLVHPGRHQYEGIEFEPGGGRSGYYNLWRGFAVEPCPGDCSKFLAHIRDNVASGSSDIYNWVVGWFARIAQRPDEKLDTALVARGKMGVGKTKLGEVMGSLFGSHYTLVADPRYVSGQFNAHQAALLLLQADEAFWAGDKRAEGKLRDLISGKDHYLEYKRVDPIRVRNFIRLFVTGPEHWVFPAGFEERRAAIIDVSDAHMQDHPYFAAIDKEMKNGGRAALLHYLLNFDLLQVNLRTIPKTAALLEQKIESANAEQAWWFDVLNRGNLPDMIEANTCPKDAIYDDYIRHAKNQGVNRRSIETKIGMFLNKYVGPGLAGIKVTLPGAKGADGEEAKYDRHVPCYRFPPLAKVGRASPPVFSRPWLGRSRKNGSVRIGARRGYEGQKGQYEVSLFETAAVSSSF
jgi:hypothetical protein